MPAFVGIIGFGNDPVARRQNDALAGAVRRYASAQRVFVQRSPRGCFIQTESPIPAHDGTLFVASSRLDNRAEIGATVGAPAHADEAECIRRVFESRGETGVSELLGSFAFAHWDERRCTLTLARDCLGRRSLFYYVGDGFVAFASHLATLLALPDVPRELDERLLANFLALNHRERETTFYRGIRRVPSRTLVQVTPAGSRQVRYWAPNYDAPPPYARDEDYIARGRELFEQAMARALRDTPRFAMLLSGGLDSSAVAATAARMGNTAIDCYTGVPPADLDRPADPNWYLDERPKVEALARLHPALRTNFVMPRGAHAQQSEPTRFFPGLPVPHRNLSNLGWGAQIMDRIKADGHSVILTGGRGNMVTSWVGRFSLAELLRQGRLPSLLREARLIANREARNIPRVIASEAMMPLLPPATHRALMRMWGLATEDISAFSLLRDDVVDELDLRRQWREDGFDPAYWTRGSGVQMRAHQIFDQLQLSRDMAGMHFEAEGIDMRDPYSDRELIEFCLSVPETLYRRHGVRRWFARQLFADRLPREILDEHRSGEQSPNWFESLDARKPIIAAEVDRLESSRLASRLIDLPRLKRLLAEWPQDARAAQGRMREYRYGLDRAIHVGQFIRWVEGGNA